MFGSAILDVTIGLLVIYLLLSLICTTITEFLAAFCRWRAKDLERGIYHLLDQEIWDRPGYPEGLA